ncbi:hypothetical protein M1293_00020 [Candidatus Parvarchaeota archaeon]|nr:hypothetical protein [Candidatus Parvarchaeota archaeon]
MAIKLVGVLAVKDVVTQGYPFLGATQSFLAVGQKLYISDCSSTDGTEEILLRIAKNKKIKLFLKQRWEPYSKKGVSIHKAYQNILDIAKSDIGNKKDTYIMESRPMKSYMRILIKI